MTAANDNYPEEPVRMVRLIGAITADEFIPVAAERLLPAPVAWLENLEG